MRPGDARRFRTANLVLLLCGCFGVCELAAKDRGPRQFLDKPTSWFASDEAKHIADNILSHQSDLGGWPKHAETTAPRVESANVRPTFDNGATTGELRYLAHVYNATHDERYRRSVERGLDYILRAQYPNGGWPQRFPPGETYHRRITFNDNAMVRLLELMREVANADEYAFVDADRRAASRRAFDRGIDCILACQIKTAGKLTAWCAQHDEIDFQPRPARKYELASLSGAESVEIVRLLMSLDDPSPAVVQAIEAAVRWFEAVKLTGIRQVQQVDARAPRGQNKVLIKDAAAPPLWARFYEIGTNRPIFVDRDGVAKYDLADIGYERRNGYSWLNDRPQWLLEHDYPSWLAKVRAPR